MDPAICTQKIANRCPQSFNRVDVDFTYAITIIVSRPFLLKMTHRGAWVNHGVITAPFVGVNLGKRVHMMGQCLPITIERYPKTNLSRLPADSPNYRWAVGGVGSPPSSPICPTPG